MTSFPAIDFKRIELLQRINHLSDIDTLYELTEIAQNIKKLNDEQKANFRIPGSDQPINGQH